MYMYTKAHISYMEKLTQSVPQRNLKHFKLFLHYEKAPAHNKL